jgi:hypothetical protein
MADSLKTLAGIQDQVAKARRLALKTKDKEASRILYQLADDLDRYVKRALFAMERPGGTVAETAETRTQLNTKAGHWPVSTLGGVI